MPWWHLPCACEVLCPVAAGLCQADADLLEGAVEDVGLVAGAGHPARHDLLGCGVAVGDVLAVGAPGAAWPRVIRSPGADPSDPVCDMFWWVAMSSLCAWAALVRTAFSVTGEQPTLLRSALTSCTMRALVPDAGAAAFEVLGDVGAAEAVAVAVAVAFGVVEGVVDCGPEAVFSAVLEGLVGVGVGVCFGFGAVGFFDVVGLGVPAGAVGDCEAAGLGSLRPVPFQSRTRSLCSVRFRTASLLPAFAAVHSALSSRYPPLSSQSLQASATDGTPRVVMVTAAMTIRR